MRAIPDSIAFSALSIIFNFIVMVFFLGDILMSARLILVGIFAIIDRLRRPHREASPGFNPRVAVLIPAYNEEKVIVRTIRSVLNSDYTNLRVIVIDDGSKDRTAEVAREAYAKEIRAGRVEVLVKPNGGKAAALNYALDRVEEEIYVGIDADTVIATDAISKLIPHFEDPEIGAVAGNAKVGNRVNLWTRWQALEYITSQNFERRALDLFNVVTVVPGAIGAWRTDAVKRAGGYPINTVAEDADLTMSLLEQRFKVVYEDRSLAFTEAPIDAKGLMRQRFRWSFGTLQAVWKHRAAFVRNKAMGLFALPNILIFQMLLPLVSPFIDLMFVYGIIHYFIDLHYHPEAASAANFQKLLAYFLAFLLIDFITSSVAFSLERPHPANKGDRWLLFHIWLQRFCLPAAVFDRAVQDGEAGHRWQAIQLGQAGANGQDEQADRGADGDAVKPAVSGQWSVQRYPLFPRPVGILTKVRLSRSMGARNGSTTDSITKKSGSLPWGLPIREFSMSSQPKQVRKSPESSPSGKRTRMKSHDIWIDHNPGDPPIDTGTDWEAVRALTDEQVYAAALADPDAQPIPPGTEEELAKLGLIKLVNVKKLRDRLGLTQEEFATRYRIPVGTLRDWEQGRKRPDAPARAYLTVIARDPHTVASLLGEAA